MEILIQTPLISKTMDERCFRRGLVAFFVVVEVDDD